MVSGRGYLLAHLLPEYEWRILQHCYCKSWDELKFRKGSWIRAQLFFTYSKNLEKNSLPEQIGILKCTLTSFLSLVSWMGIKTAKDLLSPQSLKSISRDIEEIPRHRNHRLPFDTDDQSDQLHRHRSVDCLQREGRNKFGRARAS